LKRAPDILTILPHRAPGLKHKATVGLTCGYAVCTSEVVRSKDFDIGSSRCLGRGIQSDAPASRALVLRHDPMRTFLDTLQAAREKMLEAA
jgi:hypothetical protein